MSEYTKTTEIHVEIKDLLVQHYRKTGVAITRVYLDWAENEMDGSFFPKKISLDSQRS